MGELDLAHAVPMLNSECRNSTGDGMFGGRCRIQPTPDDDWQGWPNVQQLLHGGSFGADNVKAQTYWGGEDNISPSSAHMHEPMPRTCGAHIVHYICPVEVENDQEDIVREHVDRHAACTTQFRQFHLLCRKNVRRRRLASSFQQRSKCLPVFGPSETLLAWRKCCTTLRTRKENTRRWLPLRECLRERWVNPLGVGVFPQTYLW